MSSFASISVAEFAQILVSKGAKMIGIDGCGGSGKSTLAAELAEFWPESRVIHTDDFASWDNPINWWPRMLQEALIPLHEGRTARFQKQDWEKRQLGEWEEVTPGRVIVEGVSSFRREFRPYYELGVWVETPAEERLRRGLERDGEAMHEQWLIWMDEEDAYVADHQPHLAAQWMSKGDEMPRRLTSVLHPMTK